MKEQDFSNIALLIDVENVSHTYMQKIINSIAAFGKISVRRIYSDWTDPKRDGWKKIINDFSLVTIQQFNISNAKNVSDFTLVIDAMDLLHDGVIDCFCIVSSDSDYTRLAQRIRENGKIVVGLGEKKTNNVFVNACNDFIYLDEETVINETQKNDSENISGENNLKNPSDNKNELDVNQNKEITNMALISNAVDELADYDGWAQMVRIVPYLKRIKPDFDIRYLKVVNKEKETIRTFRRLKEFFEYYCSIYELNENNTLVKKRN